MSRREKGKFLLDFSRVHELQKSSELRKVMPEAFLEAIGGDKTAILDDQKLAKASAEAFKAWHKVETRDAMDNPILLKNLYDGQVIGLFEGNKDFLESIRDYLRIDGKIEKDWDFDRELNADKFTKKFCIAGKLRTYIADIDEKDFYYTGLRKESFFMTKTTENGDEIVEKNHMEVLKEWFSKREEKEKKFPDKSYEYKDKSTSSNINKKLQEKHARTRYNNKVAVALKARKHARG